MSKKILILVFFLFSQLAYAQQKTIDSLTQLYQTATADTLKIQYAYRVAAVVKDLSVASRFIEEGLRLAQQIHNPYYTSYGQLYRSVIYQGQGNYPLAIKNAFFCLKNAQETGNPNLILTAYDNIGGIYDDQKDQKKAIYYTQQSIDWIRKINNKHKLASAYYYMSYYYDKLSQPRQALVYDQRATKLHRRVIDFLGVLSLLLVFEFITLLIHPFVERLTGHRPVFELLILVGLASVLVPAHHELTHRLKTRLAVPPVHKHKEQEG